MGVFKNGRVEIIANDQGNRITPSYVAFTAEGERLIGDAAKNQLTSNPENTVFDAKRMIGRTWGDSSVQQDIKYFPFKVSRHNQMLTNTADGTWVPGCLISGLMGKIILELVGINLSPKPGSLDKVKLKLWLFSHHATCAVTLFAVQVMPVLSSNGCFHLCPSSRSLRRRPSLTSSLTS